MNKIKKTLKIYVCGPTVYNKTHIGNLRPILTFDILNRSLNFLNQETYLIHNITDIDDKIIDKALQSNQTETEISHLYTKHYLKLLNLLNVKKPQKMPNVTDSINLIVKFIERLVAEDVAYISGDSVWFNVNKDPNYGNLSHQDLTKLIFEKNKDKKNPADFALWKKTHTGITFDSPWGKGRPGWHTECVALIDYFLKGQTLDIHGGGIDLIFPHHENEAAQFYTLYKKPLTNTWLHIGHLSVDGIKMSKSLNNTFDTEDFIKKYGRDTLRMLFLLTTPQSPIDLNDESIIFAVTMVNKFHKVFNQSQITWSQKQRSINNKQDLISIALAISKLEFAKAMSLINEQIKIFHSKQNNEFLIQMIMNLLGFNFTKSQLKKQDIDSYKHWNELKKAKKFKEADRIRKQLIKKQIM